MVIQFLQRHAVSALGEFLHHQDGIRLDHPVAAAASDAQVVAPARAFIDRIEFVTDHASQWNRGGNIMQGSIGIGGLKVLAAAIIGLSLSLPAEAQTYVGKAQAVDGDSLEIGETRFRLFGIDAVEKHQTCDRDGQTWACGADASTALAAIVERGSVNCTQRSIDQYGRIVATCLVGGYDLAEQMVRQG